MTQKSLGNGQCGTRPYPCRTMLGFTLLELLIVVTIMAVVATMVMPLMVDDRSLRVRGAASILKSDIELAQVLTISYPDDPIVFVVDTANNRYWLAPASDTATPITRDDGNPYLVTLGVDRASSAMDVQITTGDLADDTLRFNSQGGLENFTVTPRITLSIADQKRHLMISPHTGAITETTQGKSDGKSTPVAL